MKARYSTKGIEYLHARSWSERHPLLSEFLAWAACIIGMSALLYVALLQLS